MHAFPHGARAAAALVTLLSTIALADTPAGATRYAIDPTKSSLEFSFIQADAQNKGKLIKFPVTLDTSGGAPTRLEVTVDMTTLDTGDKERDDTLRGPDFFDVKKFTQAHFVATQITKTASGFDAFGKLTIRNVTRDQHVPFTLRTTNEQGHNVAYLAGRTTLHRLDFGVGQGEWKSTQWVGNDITVSYSTRLVAQQ